jgi:hypothetical protein
MKNGIPEDWKILSKWLPEKAELAMLARRHGFLTRVKGVRDMEVWLRLLLMHGGGGLSLEQTVMRAGELGLARISATALNKRLGKAAKWLEAITGHLLKGRYLRQAPLDNELLERLVAIDATDLSAPASQGSDWRLHYSLRLSDLRCEHLELTDIKGGEKLTRFAFKRGQIVLADRGYCKRGQVAHVIESGGQIVVRHCPSNFPLLDKNARPLDVLNWLRTLPGRKSRECKVWFEHKGKKHAMRLCAVRMGEQAAQKALKKVRRKAQRQSSKPRPQTEEMSGYVMVLTTLEAKEHPAAEVLKLYRYRWQVELVFKRLKTLLGIGELPKQNAGKLMGVFWLWILKLLFGAESVPQPATAPIR